MVCLLLSTVRKERNVWDLGETLVNAVRQATQTPKNGTTGAVLCIKIAMLIGG